MEKKKITNFNCPSCNQLMRSVVHRCDSCDIEVRGRVYPNAFSLLSEEMQHFLHVFIHCEGKIGEMEKALGVSYPTVKAKLAKLKENVRQSAETQNQIIEHQNLSVLEILAKIEKGELDYKVALNLIKEKQGDEK